MKVTNESTPAPDHRDEHDTAHLQALALVINALEQDEQSYVAQMQSIDQPYYVANALCRLLVEAVPDPKHQLLSMKLRAELDRYTE